MEEELNDRAAFIERLKYDTKVLDDPYVENAFRAIDRANFVFGDFKVEAYEDYALPISETSSMTQPTTIAFMLELLGIKPGEKVLEVGSGSGYVLALMAHMVGEKGEVYGVEVSPEVLLFSNSNLNHYPELKKHIHNFPATDNLGLPEKAPYDKIIVSGDIDEIPEGLKQQLKDGGVLVTPVKNEIQKIARKGDEFKKVNSHPGFSFDPII